MVLVQILQKSGASAHSTIAIRHLLEPAKGRLELDHPTPHIRQGADRPRTNAITEVAHVRVINIHASSPLHFYLWAVIP